MAAYYLVCSFGHLLGDCQGPLAAPEPYARFEYETTFTLQSHKLTCKLKELTVLPLA